jgi:hypothetical protein
MVVGFLRPFEMAVVIGGKDLLPQQTAVGLQQWRQDWVGWRLAGRQLPPTKTTISCSLLPFQTAVGVFGFFIFFVFGFLVLFFVFSQYNKCEITEKLNMKIHKMFTTNKVMYTTSVQKQI